MKKEFKVGDPVIFDDMKFIVNHKYMTKRFVRGSHIFYDDEEFEVLRLSCDSLVFEAHISEVVLDISRLRDIKLNQLL